MAKSNEIDLKTQRYEQANAMRDLAKSEGADTDYGMPITLDGTFDFDDSRAPGSYAPEIEWITPDAGPSPKAGGGDPEAGK